MALKQNKAVSKKVENTQVTTLVAKEISGALANVLLRPHVTEKSTHLTAHDTYVFVVHPKATRVAVGAAVRAMYGVQPTSVRILRQKGKVVRFKRVTGVRQELKKAMVTLPKGSKLDLQS